VSIDILADLGAEQERLETILARLMTEDWQTASGVEGWTVCDVVLHLAQSEESVAATAGGATAAPGLAGGGIRPGTLDEVMDRLVREQRATPPEVFQRWKAGRRAALAALRAADPRVPVPWAGAPLKPATLATTRLAEHWAHGLDITGPLGIDCPDTDRLRHVAWLGHSTLPYAFAVAGQEPHDVYCELTTPDGGTWRYGPPDAGSTISGPAGAFCRVGARRLAPEESGLATTGPYGPAALRVLRNYAA
jgi:uncharacterized protein (TIGR03084 family)